MKMHQQMAELMKQMGRNKGMMGKMASMMGLPGGGMLGGGTPSADELAAKLQAELASLDPKALEQLPADVREELARRQDGGRFAPAQRRVARSCGCRKAFPDCGGLPGFSVAACRNSPCRGRRNRPEHKLSNSTVKTKSRRRPMAVKMRLSRGGSKKRPYYYVVVAHVTARATAATSSRSAPSIRC